MKRLAWSVAALAGVTIPLAVWARSAVTRGQEGPGPEVARASRRDIGSAVKATGVIRPMIGAEVKVGSRVSGVVRQLSVRVGDRVSKGQFLGELEVRELMARRDQATAALASARANLDYAASDLGRKRELSLAKLISASELDLAERAQAVAEQQVTESGADLDYARTQLGYTRIYAPIAGVVASVSTREGEAVAASLAAPTFVTLLDLSRLEVWAYVDETDIGRIRSGQRARFTVDTYPEHEFEGRVTTIYPQAEIRDNVVNYVTVVRFEPSAEHTLRPEMTATVKIALDSRQNVVAVPRRAVRREGGRSFVLCLQPDGTVRRFVTTGSRDDNYWEIVEGIKEGEAVLLGEVQSPAAGAP